MPYCVYTWLDDAKTNALSTVSIASTVLQNSSSCSHDHSRTQRNTLTVLLKWLHHYAKLTVNSQFHARSANASLLLAELMLANYGRWCSFSVQLSEKVTLLLEISMSYVSENNWHCGGTCNRKGANVTICISCTQHYGCQTVLVKLQRPQRIPELNFNKAREGPKVKSRPLGSCRPSIKCYSLVKSCASRVVPAGPNASLFLGTPVPAPPGQAAAEPPREYAAGVPPPPAIDNGTGLLPPP